MNLESTNISLKKTRGILKKNCVLSQAENAKLSEKLKEKQR